MSTHYSIRRTVPALLLAALAAAAAPAQSELDDEHARTLYALGVRCGNQLIDFALTPEELASVERGIRDVVSYREVAVNAGAYRERIRVLREERRPAAVAFEASASRDFVERRAGEPGAERVPPGFLMFELRPGSGPRARASDTVRMHFHGRLRDGTVFDSSVERGAPILAPLAKLVPCWREALKRMRVGGKSRIVCPPETAYGEKGTPRVPGGAALDIEVELLAIAPG